MSKGESLLKKLDHAQCEADLVVANESECDWQEEAPVIKLPAADAITPLINSPELPKAVYLWFPKIIKDSCKVFTSYRETDAFVTSLLTVLSGCFSQVYGIYDGVKVWANLFSFVIAPAASGKGSLIWAKKAGYHYHKWLLEESKQKQTAYESELSAYQAAKRSSIQVDSPPIQPPFRLLFVPGNSSAASIISTMAQNEGRGIIAESEADTLSGALTQDWGGFSDVLRKTFHHEPCTYQRKGNREYLELEQPKLSIGLTGTPGQVSKLIASSEDGLFSRFIFYCFEVPPSWRDVSPTGRGTSLNDHFDEISFQIYQMIKTLDGEYEFSLTEEQWSELNSVFSQRLEEIAKRHGNAAVSSVKRMGLISFRLAMILTILRCFEEPVLAGNRMECLDKDFQTAIQLSGCYLEHAMIMYSSLPKEPGKRRDKVGDFFESLPKSFARARAVEVGKEIGIPEPTVGRYLQKMIREGLLKQPSYGNYSK